MPPARKLERQSPAKSTKLLRVAPNQRQQGDGQEQKGFRGDQGIAGAGLKRKERDAHCSFAHIRSGVKTGGGHTIEPALG